MIRSLIRRELRFPLIPRFKDPDALERMGAKRMGEGAGGDAAKPEGREGQ